MNYIQSDSPEVGGKRNTSKSTRSKSPKTMRSKSAKRRTSKKGGAEGGALLDDVKNLAVPFAILLAKQGLQHMFNKSKDTKSASAKSASAKSASAKSASAKSASAKSASAKSASAKSASAKSASAKSASATSRQKTVSGGSCGDQCAMDLATGGASPEALKSRFQKLSEEIDLFLKRN